MSERSATVLLVDDDPGVRDALTMLIQSEGYAVEAYDSAEAFLAACKPDIRGCVVADLRMPGMDGLRLQEEMARLGLVLPIVFLTGHGDIPTSVRAIKAGAVDFLTKPVSGSELLESIGAALAIGDRWSSEASRNSHATARLEVLTQRERAVMTLLIAGRTNKEIARQLGISHRTVEIHKAHAMAKAGAANVIELARIARDAGLGE